MANKTERIESVVQLLLHREFPDYLVPAARRFAKAIAGTDKNELVDAGRALVLGLSDCDAVSNELVDEARGWVIRCSDQFGAPIAADPA